MTSPRLWNEVRPHRDLLPGNRSWQRRRKRAEMILRPPPAPLAGACPLYAATEADLRWDGHSRRGVPESWGGAETEASASSATALGVGSACVCQAPSVPACSRTTAPPLFGLQAPHPERRGPSRGPLQPTSPSRHAGPYPAGKVGPWLPSPSVPAPRWVRTLRPKSGNTIRPPWIRSGGTIIHPPDDQHLT